MKSIPVFPLPRVVLFPGSTIPLHLFELRYRAMIEDCITHGPRAMVLTLLAPGWEEDYEGKPNIHLIAGAGRILRHRERSNGTHDILLQGICRVRLDELPMEGRLYRRAKAERLYDEESSQPSCSDMAALLSSVRLAVELIRKRYPEFSLEICEETTPGEITDMLSERLVTDPEQRQCLLETLSVSGRVRKLTQYIGDLLGTLITTENFDEFH